MDDPRLTDERTDRAMTRLEARADEWSVEVDLPAMVRNVVSPMRLNKNAPEAVRENFTARMEQQIDAIVKQAFIEGAYRDHCGTADIVIPCAIQLSGHADFPKGTKLGHVIKALARLQLNGALSRRST